MFRAIIKDRKNLDGPQIADIPVLSGEVNEDKKQKASSTFLVSDFPDFVNNGDVIGVYDSKGKFYYWGTITSKGDNPNRNKDDKYRVRTIECDQFESLYSGEHLFAAQTSSNQKAFFNNKTVSDVIDMYLTSKELGYVSTGNTMSGSPYVPTFTSFIDIDSKNTFKGIRHTIIDDGKNDKNEDEHVPFPNEKTTESLEDYLYSMFDSYRSIIRPYIRVPVLPDNYQPVLYIESDGTGQYLNTGVSPAEYLNTLRIELDAQITDVTSNPYNGYIAILSSGFYSASDTSGSRRNLVIGHLPSDSAFKMISGAQISTSVTIGTADTNRHLFILDQLSKYYKLNNFVNFSTTVNSNLYEPIVLFGYYDTASEGQPINRFCQGRIYGCKIYSNNKIIRDYIPCYEKDTLAVGLYDLVNKNFIGNMGNGTLTRSNQIYDKSINIVITKPKGIVEYDTGHSWDYSQKILFDTWESISDVEIVSEDVETNTLVVCNDAGTSVLGVFTVLQDGTIQQMTTEQSVSNRYGTGKIAYVFDSSNSLENLAQANLPASQFNHKITFNIAFDGEYKFEDFNLGQPIKFYSKNRPNQPYESSLTAWSYSIDQNSEVIHNAVFTLGNVRNNLTSKINLITKKKKK